MASVTRKRPSPASFFGESGEPHDTTPWPRTRVDERHQVGLRHHRADDVDEHLVGWVTRSQIQIRPAGARIHERLLVWASLVASGQRESEEQLPTAAESLRDQFEQLVSTWLEETLASSSTFEICTHWAYQRIIGLGPEVVPLILEAVRQGQRHWTWALAALTGENPALGTDSQRDAADAWLRWAADRGYLGHDPSRMD